MSRTPGESQLAGIQRVHPVLDRQAARRRQRALACAKRVLVFFEEAGVEGYVVGSLARGTFKAHSDVDFLVTRGVPRERWIEFQVEVERLCDGMPFHLIFLDEVREPYWRNKLLAERKTLVELEASR